jgi:hypothetical protein
MEPKRTDAILELSEMQVGVPKDIGWAMATLHDDGSVTRTCKGCGVTKRDVADPVRGWYRAVFYHAVDCAVMERLLSTGGSGSSLH